ncbi:DegV family EDD domain-containing protein [candidate division KSB3 bacterium]|uniref:DegV family EDD domain-containing protein n=1 Tax=candidate division KSB3 bacterium TaxID=2044937 RepID=A0A9D5Q768_9BACT|nr:DegV family EDD domain-containing protein [candidate division KSB3 bacterium]MBD3326128.1 DegV family EDD domain-containing protein [candidate division KSB3 bacterium]
MGQVKIVTDTTCDLPQDILQQYDIRLVPTVITIGSNVYKDTFELPVEEFYELLRTSPERPVSGPPGRKDFSDTYTTLMKETDAVISIHVSASFSSTFQSATNMAKFSMNTAKKQGKAFDITVLDSKATCIGLGIIVIEAAKLAQQGKSKDEIVAAVTPIIENMKSLFMVDDVSYLEKSGRIGKAGAVIGNFLKVKPIFSIEGGETSVKGRPMGSGGAFDKMIDLMGEAIPFGTDIKLGMAHAMSPEKLETVKPKILENYNCVEVYETLIGTSVGATMGPGSFGYVYYAV